MNAASVARWHLLAVISSLHMSLIAVSGTQAQLCGASFPSASVLGVGLNPFSMAVRDVDRDGAPDILTANATSLDISVLRNEGSRQFLRRDYFVGVRLVGIDAGDVDDDGRVDVVAGCTELSQLAIYWGQHGDSLGELTFIPSPQSPHTVGVLDLDRDDRLDVLTLSNGESAVSVIWGDGTRLMQDRLTIPTGIHPQMLAVDDVNGDSHLDLAVASCGDSTVFIVPGLGMRNFGSPFPALSFNGSNLCDVALGDLNGDIYADLAVTDVVSPRILLGVGTSSGSIDLTSITPAQSPSGVAIAELNGDYWGDVIVPRNFFPKDVLLLAGDGSGAVLSSTSLPTGASPQAPAGVDLDGDQRREVIVVNTDNSTVTIAWNEPTLLPSTVVFSPDALQSGTGAQWFAAEVVLPVSMGLDIEPSHVRLLNQSQLLSRGVQVILRDSVVRRVEVVFPRAALAGLEPGSHLLRVEGCDTASAGFFGESQVQVLPLKPEGIWQESPVGSLPILMRISGETGTGTVVYIYDCFGRLVLDKRGRIGQEGRLVWDGRDNRGERAPTGIYFVQARTDQKALSGKLILLR